MSKWKHKREEKIRNIKFVSEDNELYTEFMSRLRLENFHLRKSNERSNTDKIGYPLELTIRHWIHQAYTGLDERILCYERFTKNKTYELCFNELDVVYESDDERWITEVKVSSSKKGFLKAANQLEHAQRLLKRGNIHVKLLAVQVDLAPQGEDENLIDFQEDFSLTEPPVPYGDYPNIHFIKVDGEAVFKYGLEHGLIKNPDLFDSAKNEVLDIIRRRELRNELKEKGVPRDEWPDELFQEVGIKDDNNYMETFGEVETESPLASALKAALKSKISD